VTKVDSCAHDDTEVVNGEESLLTWILNRYCMLEVFQERTEEGIRHENCVNTRVSAVEFISNLLH
jgi:hypothetical protein